MANPDIQFDTVDADETKALIAPMLSTVNDASGIYGYVITHPDGVIETNTNLPPDMLRSLYMTVMPDA